MKVLVSGEVNGRLDLLYARVATLNASKAGPFEALFVVGPVFPPADEAEGGPAATAFEDYLCGTKEVPIQTYFYEGPSTTAEAKYGGITPGEELCPKCKYLGPGGIELVGKLTVAFLSQRHTDQDIEKILTPASSSTFLGADLFLSTDWGQHVVAGYDLTALLPGGQDPAEVGSSTVADVAVLLRPRYHFAARPSVFFQRPPYKNHAFKPKTKISHITRFLSLAPVSESKEKAKKWLHAINLEALPYMTLEALVEEPADVTESPYSVFTSSVKRDHVGAGADDGGGALKKFRGGAGGEGLSHHAMQQIQNEEDAKRADSGMFFWGGGKGGKGGAGGGAGGGSSAPQEVDPNNTTLYIGGLPAGFPADDLQKGMSHYGTITRVNVPLGKDFAFVSYSTHEEAQKALESRGMTLGFSGLRMHWSKSTSRAGAATPPATAPHAHGAAAPDGHYGPGGAGRGHGGRGGGGDQGQSECWFCVGSEKAELELLVTVGESLYMAVPKGPLCPDHVLLIPINHVPALARLNPTEWAEFERYKAALRDMYAERGLRMVLFERRLETRGAKHTHVQVTPIPGAKATEVREAFEKRGEPLGVFFEHLPAGKTLPELGLSPDQQYLYLEIPGLGGHGVARLLHRLPHGGRLPLQYGRDVLADLLEVPEKVNWKTCELSKEEEAAMVEKLKSSWEKWDFNEE